jgi:glucose/arabinose dehydrogenase
MFVAEQDGVLKAVNPDGSTKVVLSIPNRVNSAGDRGLLGIAADSQFVTNGYLYLAYTAETQPLTPDGNGAMTAQISRIQIEADSDMVPGSETIILGTRPPADGACPAPSNTVDCLPSDADTHTIGSIHSMADGTLFLGLGDGGDFNTVNDNVRRAQNEQSHAGKIMHIDRNGLGLPGNAYCPGNPLTNVCAKLHAKGFRNPFRFKPNGSGGFNLGDVGQGSREEQDLVTTAGKNYGWPCYEANLHYDGYENDQLCQDLYADEGTLDGATPPVYEYFHDDVGGDAATLGGPTYLDQGGAYPTAYDGGTFFGDYAAGFIKVLQPTGPGGALVAQPFATDWFGVDLVSAPNGDIAYASFGTGANGTGSIQRIVYSPNNARPVADAQATPQSSVPVPQTVSFDGSGSTDADPLDVLTYEWNFDNGGATVDATGPTPVFEFDTAGTYDVVLTVDDGRGKTDTDTVRVDIGNSPPVPDITGPSDYEGGDTVTLQGSATDAQDEPDSGIDLSWRSVLVHGSHDHGGQNDVPGATFDLATDDTHGADSHYEVTLTATDSAGLSATETVQLDPRKTTLRIESLPAGGDVTLPYYRNAPFATPYQALEAIGFETTVIARESFTAGGRSYLFQSWADGPTTRSRDVTVPGTPTWLVARYTDVTPPAPPAKPAVPAKPAPPAPDRSGPTFAFNSKAALYARGTRLRGTVTDPSKVRLMQVAVGRRNRRGRCYWWSATRRRLSATASSCSRPRWITAKLGAPSAKGAYRWVARLRRALPRGRYRIALKAVDGRGNVTRRVGNALTLRRR